MNERMRRRWAPKIIKEGKDNEYRGPRSMMGSNRASWILHRRQYAPSGRVSSAFGRGDEHGPCPFLVDFEPDWALPVESRHKRGTHFCEDGFASNGRRARPG